MFCFSLCYVLYAICIIFVDKTTVNAQPLSPPNFEKIAPHFKNNVFSYFASLRLRFLLFHIFVDFRLPLPPFPLGQIGPICDRFWSHVCSVLVEAGERRRRKRQNITGTSTTDRQHFGKLSPAPRQNITKSSPKHPEYIGFHYQFSKGWSRQDTQLHRSFFPIASELHNTSLVNGTFGSLAENVRIVIRRA